MNDAEIEPKSSSTEVDEAATRGHQKSISRVSETLKIALLAPAAYVVVYAYESGQASAWGIPTSMIELGTTSIIVAFASLIGLAIVFYLAAWLLWALHPSKPGPVKRSLYLVLFVAVAFLAAFLTQRHTFTTDRIVAFVVLFAMICIAEFIFPLALRRITGYGNKLQAMEKAAMARPSFLEWLAGESRSTVVVIAVLSVVLLSWINNYGRSTAMGATEFIVLQAPDDADQELIFLKRYGDYAVCAELDRTNSKILRNYRVFAFDALTETSLRTERLGVLSLEELPPE